MDEDEWGWMRRDEDSWGGLWMGEESHEQPKSYNLSASPPTLKSQGMATMATPAGPTGRKFHNQWHISSSGVFSRLRLQQDTKAPQPQSSPSSNPPPSILHPSFIPNPQSSLHSLPSPFPKPIPTSSSSLPQPIPNHPHPPPYLIPTSPLPSLPLPTHPHPYPTSPHPSPSLPTYTHTHLPDLLSEPMTTPLIPPSTFPLQ
ncbi:uncharacterized protein LOC135197936 [Macrobrachium nipponense]|uniref:uncharacterized protein LOC135197936 n=1 Tax=Macrobrachium nipponense TaxID=159736 RepID=UPI0030C8245F